jgi:hypothetical protein
MRGAERLDLAQVRLMSGGHAGRGDDIHVDRPCGGLLVIGRVDLALLLERGAAEIDACQPDASRALSITPASRWSSERSAMRASSAQ